MKKVKILYINLEKVASLTLESDHGIARRTTVGFERAKQGVVVAQASEVGIPDSI